MEFLVSLFVGKPLNILVVAALFISLYVILHSKVTDGDSGHKQLLKTSAAWGLYATWEWLIKIRTPEANIRVDLMIIWPLLAIFSVWAILRAFR